MTKIYARWTVWLHHWLLIENSLKQKPQRAAFNLFFFLTIQWLLTRKQLCPQLHNSHSWYRELCARIWVLNLCQNMKKMPCKEEIHTLFGLGRGILFIYWTTEYLLEVWMFSFLLLCLLIFIFFFVWLQWEANQKRWTNVHKILQHINFSFLTKIPKHRAHGLCDTDLETFLALKFYMWGIVNQRQVM